MTAWSKVLGPEERAEVERLVVESRVDVETGEDRPSAEANELFWESVKVAQSAGRFWAEAMIDDWSERGAKNFATALWKRRDAFTTAVHGEQRHRSLNRGKKVRRDDGTRVDVQASLLSWSVDDLKEAIVAEAMRAKEARINLDTYAKLVRLCQETGIEPVDAALRSLGLSLDEYLAQDDAIAS